MWLLLDTNITSYMGSLTAPLDLTLSDIGRSNLRSLGFWRPISHKGAGLCLYYINSNSHFI